MSCTGGVCKDLRDFILGGNFIRVAAAFVIALALNNLVTVFVAAFISPIIGIIGGKSFTDLTFTIRDSVFTYGEFLDALLAFLMISIVVFFCLVLPVQRLGGRCVPSWVIRKCPYCFNEMSALGTRCPSCCGEVVPEGKQEV